MGEMTLRPLDIRKDEGSALIVVMIFLIVLLGFAAVLTLSSMVGARASTESEEASRAYYIADSGAQVAVAMVRVKGDAMGPITFGEAIADGNAVVDVATPGPDLYQIVSTGSFREQLRTVETFVEITGSFRLPAAFSVMVTNGTEIESTSLPVKLKDTSVISGRDHDANGRLLADQRNAVYGLGANALPGDRDFAQWGTGLIEGVPAPTTAQADFIGLSFKSIRDEAMQRADITLVGNKNLGTVDNGRYGTPSTPKLVYAKLGKEGALKMSGTFRGYGTLVIEVQENKKNAFLKMTETATWSGLVLVYVSGTAEVDGKPLIQMMNSSQVLGGMALMFNAPNVKITGKGSILETSENASILFSSPLVSTAPGTSFAFQKAANVISYRVR
jgi:hypothetical protein